MKFNYEGKYTLLDRIGNGTRNHCLELSCSSHLNKMEEIRTVVDGSDTLPVTATVCYPVVQRSIPGSV